MKNLIEEKTQPNIFHIHIDAKEISKELYEFAINDMKFVDSDFAGHLREFNYMLPNKHLTLKLETREEYLRDWEILEKESDKGGLIGYLEGEYIPFDEFIPFKAFADDVDVPFKIKTRKLSGEKGEEFRQSEIHLTFMKEGSSDKLVEKLMDAGMYGINVPKKDGMFVCFTTQGHIRPIQDLYVQLKGFIEQSGGAKRCTIKEERIVNYKLYNVEPNELMEIMDT